MSEDPVETVETQDPVETPAETPEEVVAEEAEATSVDNPSDE